MKRRLLSTFLVLTFLGFNLIHANAVSVEGPLNENLVSVKNSDGFQEKDFSISPNPATSKLNIKLNRSLLNETNLDLSVYDVLGKKVYHRTEIGALETTVDVSKWNRGIYLVRISSKDSTYTKRFVKQ